MITSGSSAAIFSKFSSSDWSTVIESSAAGDSAAHGHSPPGCSPYQSRMATGVTPRAST